MRRSLVLLVLGVVTCSASPAFAQRPVRYRDVVFDKVERTGDVAFRTAASTGGGATALTLDVYQPAGDSEPARPAIIWIHGGGFRPGNDKRQKYIVGMSEAFALRGWVSVAPDYRVRANPDPDRLPALRDALEDCRAALAWVRANAAAYRIDATRIVIGGGSAGGMIAVNLAGLENADAAAAKRPGLLALVDLWGSPAAALTMTDFGATYPPTFIIHGTADTTVPFAQSEALAAALKARGIAHEVYAIPGAAHTPTADMADLVGRIVAFVYPRLGLQAGR